MTLTPPTRTRLGSPEVRRLVEGVVRRKVQPREVEDVVQTVLCAALESERIPDDEEQLRKWVVGIAHHKIADLHRRGAKGRIVPLEDEVPTQGPAEVQATSVRDLARWADEQVGEDGAARRTLEWMAREGDGDTLAEIAAEAELPPEQVRQRVSRLRRWMRERWAREVAAVAAVAALGLFVWWRLRDGAEVATPTPAPAPPSARPPELPAGNPSLLPPSAAPTPTAAPSSSASAAPSSSASAAPSSSASAAPQTISPPPPPVKAEPRAPMPKALPKSSLGKSGVYDPSDSNPMNNLGAKRPPAKQRYDERVRPRAL